MISGKPFMVFDVYRFKKSQASGFTMSIASVDLRPVLEDYLNFHGHVLDQCGLWSRESIFIFLTVSGSVVPIRVLESDSIASVKLRIQISKGVFVKNQKLVFNGKELARKNYRVRDYGVTDGNILHLVLWLSDLQTITVRPICGKEFDLQVERKRNVGYVKQQIAKREKYFVDLNDQELIWNREEVEHQRLINDLCSSDDPIDEEPMALNNPTGLPISTNGDGLKKGTRVGEDAFPEVAAYILDHPRVKPDTKSGFAGVPPTVMFEDCTFDWLYWPQAREIYLRATIEYINSLDAERDLELLKFHGWEVPVACACVFVISTMLLKKGATRGL
ncbi:Ubiquitin [Cynara cardunculus var. scolymus]|uniref:1-phosphatidylinositol 4-kinase n=1 Tax=Cynara cardunculus var. scolymus TaxID=59895 RepID=A0A103Y8W7_CYNCS|nr:Ubiquitin [Cynara cardunculus var. scolymus]